MQITQAFSSSASQSTPIKVDINDQIINLQREIDKLNKKVSKNKDPIDIDARIKKINEDINSLREANQKERDSLTTWGMSPNVWKWIGIGATGTTIITDFGVMATNIPVAIFQGNSTVAVIAVTAGGGAVGLLAAIGFGLYTLGQHKLTNRLEAFDQKVRQQELLSIFLNSYQEFIKSYPDVKPNDDLTSQISDLKKCVENLKSVPPITLPQDAKDQWLCVLIQSLPEHSEYKKKLIEQQNLAIAINQKANSISVKDDDRYFLTTSRADKAQEFEQDLYQQYKTNLEWFRSEFGMRIEEMNINGYKFDSQAAFKSKQNTECVINM